MLSFLARFAKLVKVLLDLRVKLATSYNVAVSTTTTSFKKRYFSTAYSIANNAFFLVETLYRSYFLALLSKPE